MSRPTAGRTGETASVLSTATTRVAEVTRDERGGRMVQVLDGMVPDVQRRGQHRRVVADSPTDQILRRGAWTARP